MAKRPSSASHRKASLLERLVRRPTSVPGDRSAAASRDGPRRRAASLADSVSMAPPRRRRQGRGAGRPRADDTGGARGEPARAPRPNARSPDAIDAVRVVDPPDLPHSTPGPDILAWAEHAGRVLISRDRRTMIAEVAAHL